MVFIIPYKPDMGQALNGVHDCSAPEIHGILPAGGLVGR
jgi:hypothetical protein